MKQLGILFIILLFYSLSSFGQTPLDVADLTLKVGALSTEELYYGFAEGDQIIFNFSEVDNKELKEVEITELPSSSKFMDYKSKKVDNKTINVVSKGIYKFRFYNSSISGKICKIKIQRIPMSEKTKNFNSEVIWKTIYDTTYEEVKERYIAQRDTVPELIINSNTVVHSSTTTDGTPNKSYVDFTLPQNTALWAYWIGVDQQGEQAYQKAKSKFLNSSATVAADVPEYGPLLALALKGVSYFSATTVGANIQYYFVNDANDIVAFNSGQTFTPFKQGNVKTDYGIIDNPKEGKHYIALYNSNMLKGVTVNVKILAIKVTNVYKEKTVKKYNVTSHKKPFMKT